MRESVIETYLATKMIAIGGWSIKLYAMSIKGIPDRLTLFKGKATFVELKAPGRKPTKLQLFIHAKLAKYGFKVLVIDSKEKVDAFTKTITSVPE